MSVLSGGLPELLPSWLVAAPKQPAKRQAAAAGPEAAPKPAVHNAPLGLQLAPRHQLAVPLGSEPRLQAFADLGTLAVSSSHQPAASAAPACLPTASLRPGEGNAHDDRGVVAAAAHAALAPASGLSGLASAQLDEETTLAAGRLLQFDAAVPAPSTPVHQPVSPSAKRRRRTMPYAKCAQSKRCGTCHTCRNPRLKKACALLLSAYEGQCMSVTARSI